MLSKRQAVHASRARRIGSRVVQYLSAGLAVIVGFSRSSEEATGL